LKNKDKVVIITGCSSGIGLDIAQTLTHDFTVIATVRKSDDIAKLTQQNIECYQLDLASSDSIQNAVKTIMSKYPNIYGIIHNGAYGQPGALIDISREVLTQQFETNVFGIHELNNLLLPNLIQQKSARIIYISSVLGFVCAPMRGAYNASKFALEGLAQTLRLELAHTSVKVSVIQPGPIASKFRENALNKLKANIDIKASDYQELYERTLSRLQNETPSKWTLPASGVSKKVMHALGVKPKNYYRVTTPTKVIFYLIKILPSKLIDSIMLKQ
jgi:short-subunit dehydrogenase